MSNELLGKPDSFGQWHSRLQVNTVWKSDGQELDQIIIDERGASCGFYLIPGFQYIIFAFRYTDGTLGTDLCTRTTPVEFPVGCSVAAAECKEHDRHVKELLDLLEDSRALKPNYALERSAKVLAKGAAGACEDFAPAAPSSAVPRPAQRER